MVQITQLSNLIWNCGWYCCYWRNQNCTHQLWIFRILQY